MKRILSLMMAFILVAGMSTFDIHAADTTEVLNIINYMGIIQGDEQGNLDLERQVTRAEFAKMLVAASNLKDEVNSSSYLSIFPDVAYSHWAAGYIQASTENGWINGYVDGSFRPNQPVQTQEAVTMVLRLLGYDSSVIKGTYPRAQWQYYDRLGLGQQLNLVNGDYLSRGEAIQLFYNVMIAENVNGSIYATTLGYSIDSSGDIDYSSLVNQDLEGPYISKDNNWYMSLPFKMYQATIYKQGVEIFRTQVAANDVYYYNPTTHEIWVYDDRSFGTLEAIEPNRDNPQSVVIGGVSYTLATDSARSKVSTNGQYMEGNVVGILLGSDGDAVDIVDIDTIEAISYGVVTDRTTTSFYNSSGEKKIMVQLKIVGTDGVNRTYYLEESSGLDEGSIVEIAITSGEFRVKAASLKTVNGLFDLEKMTIGGHSFASAIEIIDVNAEGDYMKVYPNDLDGMNLISSKVSHVVYGSGNVIEALILKDVTGDLYQYAYVYDYEKNMSTVEIAEGVYKDIEVSRTYEYYINGQKSFVTVEPDAYEITTGGVRVIYDDNGIDDMDNVATLSVDTLTASMLQSSGRLYDIGSDVQVYYVEDGEVYLVDIESIMDLNEYNIIAYGDVGYSVGGSIRVLVARSK